MSIILSVASVMIAVVALVYAHYSNRSAARSADAAEVTAKLDVQRRHGEIQPKFRIFVGDSGSHRHTLVLTVKLIGPPDLERLDRLDVSIRDDNPHRYRTARPGDGWFTEEQVRAHIWSPWRFIRGTGPVVDPESGNFGAGSTGRATQTAGMPVGESLPFHLEQSMPSERSLEHQTDWLRERGTVLRFRLVCYRDGWEPWTIVGEIDTEADGHVEV